MASLRTFLIEHNALGRRFTVAGGQLLGVNVHAIDVAYCLGDVQVLNRIIGGDGLRALVELNQIVYSITATEPGMVDA